MKQFILSLNIVLLFSIHALAQHKKDQQNLNTIENAKNKPTIGLGMIVDTPSFISCQYSLYQLLSDNSLQDSAGNDITPILTLKKGLTSYYIEGIYSQRSVDLKIWKKNTLINRITFTPENQDNTTSDDKNLKKLFSQISAILGSNRQSTSKIKIGSAFNAVDHLTRKEAGSISTFIYADALNYTPALAFKTELYDLYSDKPMKTEFEELKELKGKKFKFQSYADYVEKTYPHLPKLFQAAPGLSKNAVEQAQYVFRAYRANRSEHFFFDSKYIDDKAKIAARKIAFPLWKRPGTSLTYYSAAMTLLDNGYTDAALECFYSALLMVDGLNTFPSVTSLLKHKIYDGMYQVHIKEGNTGSATYSQSMSALYKNLINTKTIVDRSLEYKKISDEISGYFSAIETNALTARTEKRAAFWNTLTSVVAVAASAVNDGANGLTTLSPETQSLMSVASDNMDVTGDYKLNSLNASSEAAHAFNKVYGGVLQSLQNANGSDIVGQPIVATDFVKRLGDKTLSTESKNHFLDFSNKVTGIAPDVNEYFNASTDQVKTTSLQNIYRKMALMEIKLSIKESMGEKPLLEIVKN